MLFTCYRNLDDWALNMREISNLDNEKPYVKTAMEYLINLPNDSLLDRLGKGF